MLNDGAMVVIIFIVLCVLSINVVMCGGGMVIYSEASESVHPFGAFFVEYLIGLCVEEEIDKLFCIPVNLFVMFFELFGNTMRKSFGVGIGVFFFFFEFQSEKSAGHFCYFTFYALVSVKNG